jgi:F-type H+-transporting ATPase subunit b
VIAVGAGLAAIGAAPAADVAEQPHATAGIAGPAKQSAQAQAGPQTPAVEAEHPASAEASHGEGHAEHDPYDLSHADAGKELANPIEPRYDMAIATFIVFVVLFLLLRRFAWSSIKMGLDRREAGIAARIEQAQRGAEDAAEQLRLYQAKLAAAGQEAQELLTRARREGEASADAIRREAQQSAARERDRAIADIRAAKNAAVTEIAQRSADMAVLLAGRIVRRELNEQDHTAMIAEALEKFPSQN